MEFKKAIAVAAVVSMVGLASVAGLASAQASNNSLVDKIAQKFNLDKSEVQKVFDEDRSAREAGREQRYEERLTRAVKDGKLTEDQKTKILAKHKEFEAQRNKLHDEMMAEKETVDSKTEAERENLREEHRAEMEKLRSDIEAWEKANSIPSGYLLGGGMGHGHGHGLGHMGEF